jgi:H+/Cl- antiporter ClcA
MNLGRVLNAADDRDRMAFAWWLEWSRCLPNQQRGQVFKNKTYIRAHLLLWQKHRASPWWLVVVMVLCLVVFILLIRWSKRGATPVDPAAETLERVDPIDLDTQAVTLSNPGLETDDLTTVGEEPVN